MDDPPPPLDAQEFARAAEDFMRNSPVFAATGRPVQRTTDATGYTEPDAVAVATLARDLGRLGVPEPARPDARSKMLGLAALLENAEPDWDSLRNVIGIAMQYPELARRLLPVLLPWLDRAA